ncbi:phenazine biosynthesis protein phzE [Catenulispora sp. GP43]|uniref:anthranilate synthase family protein n=1 Tax=Catenulispora sp. GP43 TaxID=3156263 RepID=UPI00351372FA
MSAPTDRLSDCLRDCLRPDAPPFALLYRPERHSDGGAKVELLTGDLVGAKTLLVLPSTPGACAAGDSDGDGARHDLLAVIPFRQIAERGFAVADDGAELVALRVRHAEAIDRDAVIAALPAADIRLDEVGFDVSDEDYSKCVRLVQDQEIGRGEGSNFVVPRTYVACVQDYSRVKAAALFRNLLTSETGAYWTFLVHLGEDTFVGASPERQVSVDDGVAVMNPISGTHVFGPAGPDRQAVAAFLDDRKETEELAMVLEEELKMMAEVCDGGGRALGPFLKPMGHLAHTEYLIEGATTLPTREVLRRTLFSPAVTGSPLASAFRVIARREKQGRGYYGGVVALFGADKAGRPTLDSSILIRTARITRAGVLSLTVGSTVVRHSDPDAEAAETVGKAAGLLAALRSGARRGAAGHAEAVVELGTDPAIRRSLARRNDGLATFWLAGAARPAPSPTGLRATIIDAEDSFTAMLAHQLRALGLSATVSRFDEPLDLDAADLVVLGPGPGDPRRDDDPKMLRLAGLAERLLAAGKPLLGLCLGHQVVALRLGLPVRPLPRPRQGSQRRIEVFGETVRVGFYNSFAAYRDLDTFQARDRLIGFSAGDALAPISKPAAQREAEVAISGDPATGEVYALRRPGLWTCQFHPESVLSPDGLRVLDQALAGVHAGYRRLVDRGGVGAS